MSTRRGIDSKRVALLEVIVKHGAEQVVGRGDGACISPVKCRLMSSIGTTCA